MLIMALPQLGHHFEICISVDNLAETVSFYQKLGFEIYTGGKKQEWCTVTDGKVYLAFFPKDGNAVDIKQGVGFNYRGGNVKNIVAALKLQGIKFTHEKFKSDGTGSAKFFDNNGNLIFLDTAEDEERIDI